MRRLQNQAIPIGLILALAIALGLRLLLWGQLPRTGLISDEGEYLSAATWLADGRGFDWYQGYLWTRAPLYPLIIATHLRLFGPSLIPIFITQTFLSLANVVCIFFLARQLVPTRRALAPCSAIVMALYLPFALYTQMLLSETLFLFLLLAALLSLARPQPSLTRIALAGVLLGLATLTRSLTLGFLPILAIWLLLQPQSSAVPQPTQRWKLRILRLITLTLSAACIILPWSFYNSHMYGGPILVDTSGAFNVLLGARAAADGHRSDAPVRDYVLGLLGQPTSGPLDATCAPYPGQLPNQAARQSAMLREGFCLIGSHPAAFIQKSLTELIDLFQLNYTGAERFTDGFSTGRLAPAYLLALFTLDDSLYIVALPLAVIGWALARTRARSPLIDLSGLWWIYNLAVAPLLFAINRFRLPLLPLAFIFACLALLTIIERIRPAAQPVHQAATNPSDPAAFLPLQGITRHQRRFLGLASLLAILLWLVAATPYAYLEPRAPTADSRWASYLGPYPSSLAITGIALAARPRYQHDLQFQAALQHNDLTEAARLLQAGQLGRDTSRLGPAMLAARQGHYQAALALLPPEQPPAPKDALAAVVQGDILRSLGDTAGALATLSARSVDDANPVDWAWEWLNPAPTQTINLGGSLDIGYVRGCYLGEGDSSIRPPANFRWCADGAQLRFPAAATGSAQTLILRADGRAWQSYGMRPPPVRVVIDGATIGSFSPDPDRVGEYRVPIPARQRGTQVLITLRTAVLTPDAARYNSQQGQAVVGQVQQLGIRLDWAELR